MTTLTKKDLEQVLDKRIDPLAKILRQTTALMTHLVEDVRELKTDMRTVKKTLNAHTTTLDAIYKNTEHWKTEAASLQNAIKRHEDWIAQLADKLGVKLEGLQRDQAV